MTGDDKASVMGLVLKALLDEYAGESHVLTCTRGGVIELMRVGSGETLRTVVMVRVLGEGEL